MCASHVSCRVSCGSIWQHEETLNSTAHARDGIENRCSGPCNITDTDAFARKAGRVSGKLARLCWCHCRVRQWRQLGEEGTNAPSMWSYTRSEVWVFDYNKQRCFRQKIWPILGKISALVLAPLSHTTMAPAGSRRRIHSQHVIVQKKCGVRL